MSISWKLVHSARATNVFSHSVHLFTLSITNQNTQQTIEYDEKNNFSSRLKAQTESQGFSCGEKQLSQKTGVASGISLFPENVYSFR